VLRSVDKKVVGVFVPFFVATSIYISSNFSLCTRNLPKKLGMVSGLLWLCFQVGGLGSALLEILRITSITYVYNLCAFYL
jgi:hypothetical protein